MDRFETFTTTIAFVNRCVQKIKSLEMQKFGLKSTDVLCIYHLEKQPQGLTASELCTLCGEDKAAVSRTLGTLAQNDYVRVDGTGDKRAYRAKVFLTEKGRQIGAYIDSRVAHVLDTVGAGLSEAERSAFYHGLRVISAGLQDYLQAEAAT